MELFRLVWVLFLATTITLVFSFVSIMGHERVHQVIFLHYGVESKIEVGSIDQYGFLTFHAVPQNDFNGSREDYRAMMSAHELNETIAYNLSPYFMALLFLVAGSFFWQLTKG